VTHPNLKSAASQAADAPRSGSILEDLTRGNPGRGEYSITFRNDGDFAAIEAAIAWLKKRGFSVGEMQRDDPIGVVFGDVTIHKWRTLSAEDRNDLHGKIMPSTPAASMRGGPVTFHLRRSSASSVIEAFRSEQVDPVSGVIGG